MSTTAATTTTTASKGGKYLTFSLGREEFGLGILAVREIIGYMDVTLVPRTPSYVRGVINLRGQVISVIDLRAKFGMDPAERTERTCIVVVEINNGGRRLSTGLIVDRVSEVLTVPAENIEEAPDFGANVRTDFILGMGKVGSSVKILLNIDRVLGAEEIEAIAGAAGEAA